MTVTLTPLAAGHDVYDLLPPTDPASGILTFTARPSRHSWAVSQSMLEAFGVRADIFGAGRAHGEDLDLLRAWIQAFDIRVVAIRHASTFRDPALLDALALLATETETHLALTCDDDTGVHLFDWVNASGGSVETTDAMLSDLLATQARPASPPTPLLGASAFPAFVPRVDFYAFRARCKQTLSASDFKAVDNLYRDVFLEVQRTPFVDSKAASERLVDLCSRQEGSGQVRTVVRAAQAAMLTRESLLKVDLDRFLNLVRDSTHRRMTHSELLALRAYRTPWRSSVVVLRDCNLSRDRIAGLTLADISDDGSCGATDAWPVPAIAKVYLLAQKQLRTNQGASTHDQLITQDKPTIALAQRRVSSELGVPTARGGEFTSTRAADRWQHELGATLFRLVGPTQAASSGTVRGDK